MNNHRYLDGPTTPGGYPGPDGLSPEEQAYMEAVAYSRGEVPAPVNSRGVSSSSRYDSSSAAYEEDDYYYSQQRADEDHYYGGGGPRRLQHQDSGPPPPRGYYDNHGPPPSHRGHGRGPPGGPSYNGDLDRYGSYHSGQSSSYGSGPPSRRAHCPPPSRGRYGGGYDDYSSSQEDYRRAPPPRHRGADPNAPIITADAVPYENEKYDDDYCDPRDPRAAMMSRGRPMPTASVAAAAVISSGDTYHSDASYTNASCREDGPFDPYDEKMLHAYPSSRSMDRDRGAGSTVGGGPSAVAERCGPGSRSGGPGGRPGGPGGRPGGPGSRPGGPGGRLGGNKQTFVEIMPGVEVKLRSANETWNAIENDFYRPVTCFGCTTELLCISDADYVLCPDCRVVSPMDVSAGEGTSSGGGSKGGVGMGFKYDDLFRWQSEIMQQRG